MLHAATSASAVQGTLGCPTAKVDRWLWSHFKPLAALTEIINHCAPALGRVGLCCLQGERPLEGSQISALSSLQEGRLCPSVLGNAEGARCGIGAGICRKCQAIEILCPREKVSHSSSR